MSEYNYLKYAQNASSKTVSAHECFDALTPEQNMMVENSTTILEFAKGETIIKQGYVATHVLYIENGLARLEVTNDQKTSTVSLLGKNSFVGLVCSFACINVDFSAVALEKTTIQMIDMDLFQRMIRENGEFALKLIKHMSLNTNNMVHWISRLASKNVDGSIALILKRLSNLYESSSFSLPVTRKGLAEIAGCSKESAINVLTRFHNDNIISIKDRELNILDSGRLEMIIKQG